MNKASRERMLSLIGRIFQCDNFGKSMKIMGIWISLFSSVPLEVDGLIDLFFRTRIKKKKKKKKKKGADLF
jgi:hypothetical protein